MKIFVFGSNLAGRHGAGSALEAKNNWGAEYGIGIGRTGNAYAIPTKDEKLNVLPLVEIIDYIEGFKHYARLHPELEFVVVKIGCGLAGYEEGMMKQFFCDCPVNCELPEGWRE